MTLPLDPRGIDAIVFDLDGTLLALGAPPASRLARRLWLATETPLNYGMLLLGRSGLESSMRPLLEVARRFKGIATASDLRPIGGAAQTLRTLSQHYRLGVLTNRGRREAMGFLDSAELTPLFGSVTTRDDLWRLKPHPAALRTVLAHLSCSAARALVVGDLPADMQVAVRAGAVGVGVRSGFATHSELEAAGARLVLDDVNGLPEILLGAPAPSSRAV